MKVLAVVGPSNAGKTTLVERLAERLGERGRVATVKHLNHPPDIDTEGRDTARHRAAGATATYGLGEDGWFATGEARTLDGVLEELASEYDYAVIEGYSDAHLPSIVLGDGEHAGRTLAAASSAKEVDIETVLEAIAGLEEYVTLESLVRAAKTSPAADRAGAIATFTGQVRAKDTEDDTPTESLEFETYDDVADERMAAISAELEERKGVFEVLMHHRTGVLEAGADIVFVVVLAGHRREAFRTVEDGIDRLKDEVPIFKKEVTTDEEFWVHERA